MRCAHQNKYRLDRLIWNQASHIRLFGKWYLCFITRKVTEGWEAIPNHHSFYTTKLYHHHLISSNKEGFLKAKAAANSSKKQQKFESSRRQQGVVQKPRQTENVKRSRDKARGQRLQKSETSLQTGKVADDHTK
ncbi:hypothetical protein HYC85_029336 [Camellia sinensis]|uniref:Uncharacterized protein n=1 Tax=Camellia sinensis TaxID=4442 RepID=A0A7J7FXU6_CAMSI|nr:hypothetical protein HYC85_029336 [Camellia sinensis]